MNLNEFCKVAFDRAEASGWTVDLSEDPKQRAREILGVHCLMISEIIEAGEEVRNGMPPFYLVAKITPEVLARLSERGIAPPVQNTPMFFVPKEVTAEAIRYCVAMALEQGFELGDLKPEGEAVELADAMIRIGHWTARHGWDMEATAMAKLGYNATRGHRHGGKAA